MSFWGLSDAGSQAKGFPLQFGNWNFDQYKNWLDQQNQFGGQGNFFNNQAGAYWNSRAQTPPAGVEDIRNLGTSIMPFQGALDRRNDRFNQMLGNYRMQVTPGDTAGDRMRGYLDETGGNISRTGDQISGEINDSARNMIGQTEAGYNDIIGNLIKQSGNLQDFIGKGYAGVGNILGQGYDQAFAELNKSRPGGEFQTATAARSFAPAKANVMRRLISSGVDPNSPEGIAAMSNVNEQQARAMDDTMGSSMERFADKAMNLNLGRGNALAGAAEAGLGASTGVAQNLLNAVPGFQQNALNTRLGIEQGRSGAAIGNLQQSRDLSNQLLGQRGQQELLQRGMQQEDWGIGADILNRQNQDELLGIDLGNQQFNQGLGFQNWQQQQQDLPYQMLYGMGQDALNNMFQSGSMARGFGNDALNAMLQQYQIELPNAGWGAKMLGGLAAPFINMGLGKLGNVAGNWLGKLFGGGGGSNTGLPSNYIYGGG